MKERSESAVYDMARSYTLGIDCQRARKETGKEKESVKGRWLEERAKK